MAQPVVQRVTAQLMAQPETVQRALERLVGRLVSARMVMRVAVVRLGA